MNHDSSEPIYDERRENVWAVIGTQVIRDHRPQGRPSEWPQRPPNESQSESPAPHPLDVAYETLSSLLIDGDAADIDLMLDAVRAERLKGMLSQYQDALLEQLNGSPEDRTVRRARGLARYGRDYLAELHSDTLSSEELAALLPWPPARH